MHASSLGRGWHRCGPEQSPETQRRLLGAVRHTADAHPTKRELLLVSSPHCHLKTSPRTFLTSPQIQLLGTPLCSSIFVIPWSAVKPYSCSPSARKWLKVWAPWQEYGEGTNSPGSHQRLSLLQFAMQGKKSAPIPPSLLCKLVGCFALVSLSWFTKGRVIWTKSS